LRQGLCHIATSHLAQENDDESNFSFEANLLNESPAIVNFCRREQGLLVPKGNPKNVQNIADIGTMGLSIANRPLDASTRILLDREFKKIGLDCRDIKGYEREFQSHLEIGLEVLAGRADTGPAIRAVAAMLGLDFVPLRWERFDMLIPKNDYFAKSTQLFLELLHSDSFLHIAKSFVGYDLSLSGKMVFPAEF
jgi:molybdate-binding protein